MATQNQLQRAIEEGDKRTFARLIHDGVDVNVRLTVDGDTLLFKAIREDQEGRALRVGVAPPSLQFTNIQSRGNETKFIVTATLYHQKKHIAVL